MSNVTVLSLIVYSAWISEHTVEASENLVIYDKDSGTILSPVMEEMSRKSSSSSLNPLECIIQQFQSPSVRSII